jgi:hypothetical protein
MIKMSGENDKGRKVLILGLSEGNLGELRKGHPIHIHAEQWGQDFDLMIFWGKTDQACADLVKPFIGPDTVVRDELTNKPKRN